MTIWWKIWRKDVAESVTKRPCSCIHDEGVEGTLNVDANEAVDSVADSGVTMGWLLRLVTGAPLVVGAPDSSILF